MGCLMERMRFTGTLLREHKCEMSTENGVNPLAPNPAHNLNFSLLSVLERESVLAKVGTVAYRLELPQQLSRVHSTFHVSNLKKCLSDEPLAVPLDEIHIDDKLCFVEEPVEIMEHEVKRLKQSHIPIIKVRWNSRRAPEFTWEREDQFRKNYPQWKLTVVTLVRELCPHGKGKVDIAK
ncbi:hypothetical protein Tco_0250894 [Tanacetum coccineum]